MQQRVDDKDGKKAKKVSDRLIICLGSKVAMLTGLWTITSLCALCQRFIERARAFQSFSLLGLIKARSLWTGSKSFTSLYAMYLSAYFCILSFRCRSAELACYIMQFSLLCRLLFCLPTSTTCHTIMTFFITNRMFKSKLSKKSKLQELVESVRPEFNKYFILLAIF